MKLYSLFLFFISFILTILFSFPYFYSRSFSLEKPLLSEYTKISRNFLLNWANSFIQNRINSTKEEIEKEFNEKIELTNNKEEDLEKLLNFLDKIHIKIENFTLPENFSDCISETETLCEEITNLTEEKPEFCLNRSLILEECKYQYIVKYPLSSVSLSATVSLLDAVNFINSEKIDRPDTLFSKLYENTIILSHYGILAYWCVSKVRAKLDCLEKNLTSYEKRISNAIECVKGINEWFEEINENISKNLEVKELNLKECSQYLPLISFQNLTKNLIRRTSETKAPMLQFFYKTNIKIFEECKNEAFHEINQTQLPCYKPESFSLTYNSIEATIATIKKVTSCVIHKHKEMLREEKWS